MTFSPLRAAAITHTTNTPRADLAGSSVNSQVIRLQPQRQLQKNTRGGTVWEISRRTQPLLHLTQIFLPQINRFRGKQKEKLGTSEVHTSNGTPEAGQCVQLRAQDYGGRLQLQARFGPPSAVPAANCPMPASSHLLTAPRLRSRS